MLEDISTGVALYFSMLTQMLINNIINFVCIVAIVVMMISSVKKKVVIKVYRPCTRKHADTDPTNSGRTHNQQFDIESYSDPHYNWRQMEQLRLGLQNGIDITAYADPGYNWRQMREIRHALEKKLDVTPLAKRSYNYAQMEQIALGLEYLKKHPPADDDSATHPSEEDSK